MANGEILTREVGDDIERLNAAATPRGCELGPAVRVALIRALRMAEVSYRVNTRNTILLLVLIAFSVKVQGTGLIELVLKLLAR